MAGYCAACPHGYGQHQQPDPILIHRGTILVWPEGAPMVCVKHEECGCLGFVQGDHPWERRPDPRIDNLGTRQSGVLVALRREGGWDDHAGWQWRSARVTREVLDSLVRRGYAVVVDGVYRPTPWPPESGSSAQPGAILTEP